MCRLFGLSAAPERVYAKFWLLEAPDSFLQQSRRNPDGTGLGSFDAEGAPLLDKQALPAFKDPAFVREAKTVESAVFVSHIRYATTGDKTYENCHPFSMDGRIFAHNGVLGNVPELAAHLGEAARAWVKGQTDSEHYMALITQEIRAHAGDVTAGIAAAVEWIAAKLPVFSLNFLLATPNELWAFRYPLGDELYVLERPSGGHHGNRHLHYASSRLRVHSPHLASRPAVVVASEPLDDSPSWRLLRSGELIHIAPDQQVGSRILIDSAPAHPLVLPAHVAPGVAA